jgi:hypothetical protein
MPTLTTREKRLIGPLISPFQDSNKTEQQKEMKDGEFDRSAFEEFIHPGERDGKPSHRYAELTLREIRKVMRTGRCPEKCFLWIIDETSIRLIREKIRNPTRQPPKQGYICHTNITGWGTARAGGELFFGRDGRVYINPFSDRYGGDRLLRGRRWPTIIQYFKRVGYKNLVDIMELLEQESDT